VSNIGRWWKARETASGFVQIEAGQPSRYNSLLPTMPAETSNPETKQVLEITDIMAILPHRYPFLLIDRVVEIERMKRIVAIKNVTIHEAVSSPQ
jgi:hypothetical protein